MDSTARVAKFIYENGELFLKLKQNKVAALLNIAPETMSRTMRKFKEKGIVNLKDGVMDRDKLKALFD
jgi:CRP/FNR family transcriptional regulator